MVLLQALQQTPGALRRNPVLFLPMFVIMVFQIPSFLLQAVNPLISSVVSLGLSAIFIFVMPFFQAGLFGMADEALDGRTSISRFFSDGKSNYVSVLGAYLVVVAVNVAIGIAAVLIAIPLGLVFYVDGGRGYGLAVLIIIGGIALLLGLAYLVFIALIQFYGQAIVLDGFGAIDGIKQSVSIVRQNLLSVFGYTILVAIIGGLAGILFSVISILITPQSSRLITLPQVSLPSAFGLVILIVVVGSLLGGFLGVFSVAYYRGIRGAVHG